MQNFHFTKTCAQMYSRLAETVNNITNLYKCIKGLPTYIGNMPQSHLSFAQIHWKFGRMHQTFAQNTAFLAPFLSKP